MTACFPSSFRVCQIIDWLSLLVSHWKSKNCVSAAPKFPPSFQSAAVLLADGRRVKKSDFKKMNIRPPCVCEQVFLVSVEISRSPGVCGAQHLERLRQLQGGLCSKCEKNRRRSPWLFEECKGRTGE